MEVMDNSSGFLSSDQINLATKHVLAPKYEYLQVSLLNQASGDIPIAANATTALEFKLPSSRQVNFAKSYVNYSLAAPLIAANTICGFGDVSNFCSQASLSSSNGTEIMRLDNVQQYLKVLKKIDTPLDEFMTSDNLDCLFRSNLSKDTNFLPAGGTATEEFIEPLYRTSSGVATALSLQQQFKFSSLKGTVLGVDRDFYCPSEMYLRFQTPRGDNMVWAQTNTNAGATAPATVPGLVMSNVTLFLAVEKNPVILDINQKLCLAGALEYQIPYTVCNRQTGAAVGSNTDIQIGYNNSQGHRLKRIVTTAMRSTETKNFSFDADNTDGVKVKSYNTFMDNARLQERVLSCEKPAGGKMNNDDWAENRRFIDKGRSCYLSKEMYSRNWFHMDSFTENQNIQNIPEVNLDRGKDMAIPKLWQFSAKVSADANAGNLVHYTFAEFIRPIKITPLGVELVPYPLISASVQTRG